MENLDNLLISVDICRLSLNFTIFDNITMISDCGNLM